MANYIVTIYCVTLTTQYSGVQRTYHEDLKEILVGRREAHELVPTKSWYDLCTLSYHELTS